ncbi:hypothetical protein BH10ACT7_BH10ACT7_25350 [soil metagenome]
MVALLHVDADSFFASVALRTRPHLVERPVAAAAHVIITSANYPARARGVRSAMLVADALRLCPELVIIDVPQAEIEEVAEALFDVFHSVAGTVEPGSMEEAFLDVGAGDLQEAASVGHQLRARVAAELGIPVSVGVGTTKLMAKLGSRAAKPDGLHVVDAVEEARLRSELPTVEIWGVGGKTLERLTRLGVLRIGDLDHVPAAELQRECGTTMARRLRQIREGTDDAALRPVEQRTSLSAGGSIAGYARPNKSPAALAAQSVDRACHRAERAGLVAGGMTLTLTPEDGGGVILLKHSLADPTASAEEWGDVAAGLIAGASVPLLSSLTVTLTGLQPADRVAPTLF